VRGKADGFTAFGLHRQWLAGRPSREGTPDLPFAGLQRRSGRFPALPYPPVEQMGCSEFKCVPESVSRFPFPGGPIERERETTGDLNAKLS
jgi:hypothetical protein